MQYLPAILTILGHLVILGLAAFLAVAGVVMVVGYGLAKAARSDRQGRAMTREAPLTGGLMAIVDELEGDPGCHPRHLISRWMLKQPGYGAAEAA